MANAVSSFSLGISYMILSTFVGALSAIIVSYIDVKKEVILLIFFQSLLAFFISFKKGSFQLKKLRRNSITLTMRTICGLGIYYSYYKSLGYKDPVLSSLLMNTAPIIVPFFLIYKQKIRAIDVISASLCFMGLLIFQNVSTKNFTTLTPSLAWGLLSAVCFALTIVFVDNLKQKLTSIEIINFYSLISLLIITPLSIPYLVEVFDMPLWFYLLNALLFYARQFTINEAIGKIPAIFIGPLNYLVIIFIALYNVIFRNEVIHRFQILGFLIIMISFILVKFGSKVSLGLYRKRKIMK